MAAISKVTIPNGDSYDLKVNVENLDIYNEASLDGSIVTFNDGGDGVPLEELIVTMEPIQDLHGCDQPYPAGISRNLIPYPYYSPDGLYSNNGISIVTNEVGKITTAGKPINSASFIFYLIHGGSLSAGTYTLSITGPHANVRLYLKDVTSNTNIAIIDPSSSNKTTTFTIEEDITNFDLYLNNSSSSDAPNFNAYVQLENGSSATAWVPYANICSITGYTGCIIETIGKNLFNKNTENIVTGSISNHTVMASNNTEATKYRTTYIPCKPNTYYTASKIQSLYPDRLTVSWSENIPTLNGRERIGSSSGGANNSSTVGTRAAVTIQTGATAKYLICWFVYDYSSASNNDFNTLMIELGSTASSYEPYAGDSYSVSWQSTVGTVYKATLNVLTGVLTSYMGEVDLGTLNWDMTINGVFRAAKPEDAKTYYSAICSHYKYIGDSIEDVNMCVGCSGSGEWIILRDDRYTDTTTFTAAMSGVKLVYELATPQTYQLTPQQVTTLLGTNNIWSDAGDVSVKYIAPITNEETDLDKYFDRRISDLMPTYDTQTNTLYMGMEVIP